MTVEQVLACYRLHGMQLNHPDKKHLAPSARKVIVGAPGFFREMPHTHDDMQGR